MLRSISAALILFLVPSPQEVSPGDIFSQNKEAVVRIFANGHVGCGFVVSSDGLIVTANHVITTEESGFTEPVSEIDVQRSGEKRSHPATVIAHSEHSDTALLRIIGAELPHVTVETWDTLAPSSVVTVITFLPGSEIPLLLIGNVSGTAMLKDEKITANAIIFQMPIRKGFSGSPIFNSKGHAIGIVNTRLIGISHDLDTARQGLKDLSSQGQISFGTVDIGKTLLGLIDSLDADLVSGLGTAVDIAYAQKMLAEAEKNNKKR